MAHSDEPSDRSDSDDADLFARAMRDVRRNEDRRALPRPQRRPPPIPRHRAALRRHDPSTGGPAADSNFDEFQDDFEPEPTDLDSDLLAEDSLQFTRAGVSSAQVRRLRRGRITVQRQLDLHGLRSQKAERMLREFLAMCAREDVRCVRIVHGKGLGSPAGKPVLKAKLARWLRHDSRILAYCSALPHDGGTGALYAMLKASPRQHR